MVPSRFLKVFRKNKQFCLILVISVLITMAGSLIEPIEARFIGSLTDSPFLMTLVFSAGSFFLIFFSFFLGRLSVSHGKRNVILAGAVVAIIYPLIYATSFNLLQYVGGRMVWAFAGAATGPVLSAYLEDILSKNDKKGAFTGVFFSARSGAGMVGCMSGGFIADVFGLRANYWVLFFLMLLTAMFTFLLFRVAGQKDEDKKNALESEGLAPSDQENFAESSSMKLRGNKGLLFPVFYIVSRPSLLYHLVLNTAFQLYWSVKVILIPLTAFYMTGSNLVVGSIFASMGFIAMVVLPFAGKFVDKKGFFKGYNISFLFLCVASLMMAFSRDITSFWIFAVLFAVGEAVSAPAKYVLEIENIESGVRGEMLGFFFAYNQAVATVGPIIAGTILVYASVFEALMVFSVFMWIFFALAHVIYYAVSGKHAM